MKTDIQIDAFVNDAKCFNGDLLWKTINIDTKSKNNVPKELKWKLEFLCHLSSVIPRVIARCVLLVYN